MKRLTNYPHSILTWKHWTFIGLALLGCAVVLYNLAVIAFKVLHQLGID